MSRTVNDDIREKIKNRRLELGLTLEQVGDSIGVGKSTVRRWEEGFIKNIGSSNLLKLSKALRVPVSYLLEDSKTVNIKDYPTWGDVELFETVMKEILPLYSKELSDILKIAYKLDKKSQKLAIKLLKVLEGDSET